MEGGGFFSESIMGAPSLEDAADVDEQHHVSAEDPYGPQVAEGLRRRHRRQQKRTNKLAKNKLAKGDKIPLLVIVYNYFYFKIIYELIWIGN